ncbi:unnamed protein product [Chondrus crispus]|uniref:Sodium/calcium exchanger membrane region domain-containing protein n=1 Tax=Chondrus crispus TaxID=2769 RepID=R7QEG4_CHOCR|nr:unnamed protein product [Chondrus crispus]CDF36158.1 unnamed protein product [Chondrus crispus]|eukprot:XP_005715977.1 unnamed protein product [Chondrus crispus]
MRSAILRRRGTFGKPRRQDSVPYASLCFLIGLGFCAVWFSGTDSPNDSLSTENSLLGIVAARNSNSYGDLCDPDKGVFGSEYALFFLIPGIIVAFVGLAIVTDDYFVAALERICERLDLSEDVAGATFMAAGSSTPEFFASMLSVFVTEDEVGIGTIVGSAVFNVLVIIGLSAALAGSVLSLDWRPLARDSAFYMMSIVLLLTFVLGSSRGEIKWYEGLILVFGYVLYVLFMAFGNKPYMKWAKNLKFGKSAQEPDLEKGDNSPGDSEQVWTPSVVPDPTPTKTRYSDLTPRSKFRAAQFGVIATIRMASHSSSQDLEDTATEEKSSSRAILGVDLPSSVVGWIFFPLTFFWRLLFSITIVDCSVEKKAKYWWATFILSIIWISVISYVMVEAARFSGCLIGIPASAMGLTVLAAGTSVPDALASISVARGGSGDMAVSNAIGSNVFDILLGLGFPWFIGGLAKKTITIPTDPITTVVVPILILFAIIVLLLVVLVVLRWKLRPLLGYILFGVYGLFVTYTLLDVYVFKLNSE